MGVISIACAVDVPVCMPQFEHHMLVIDYYHLWLISNESTENPDSIPYFMIVVCYYSVVGGVRRTLQSPLFRFDDISVLQEEFSEHANVTELIDSVGNLVGNLID